VRTVVVTGGGRGMGAACAARFHESGFNVVMASRTASELEKTAKAIDPDLQGLFPIAGDVSEESFVQELFAKAHSRFGAVHILINNAAILVAKSFAEHSIEDWDRTMAVNLRGAFLCSRELFRQPKSENRLIVNVSSLGGIQHTQKFPGLSAYTASKSGLTGLTEALAVEGAPLGIRVIGIAPGAVDTEMLRRAAPNLKAGATPRDIASIVVDLANSPSSAILNGAMIPLDTNR
jgi:NAD(P)-dependent dehydrogenase (short-subunit alcohol dehydrogenase family)